VEVTPWNLAEQSQSFTTSGGAWNYTAGSGVTTGQTGYDGTTNAVLFTDSGANGDYGAYQGISQLGSQTFSIYAKAGSVSSFSIDIYQTPLPRVIVNLSNGTITSGSGVIESVGNGWYRISVTAVMTTTYYVRFGCTVAGNVYIQNAQLNIGSTAKPYFPTTDRLNVPRLTYQNGGGGCPSLLLEKQSTNSQTYSEQIDNAVWGLSNLSVTANNTTSPDGTQNADKIVEDTANARHEFYGISLAFNGNNAISFYAKNAGRRYLCALEPTGAGGATFDLQNGVVNAVTAVSASIESVGNGWYRCSVIISKTATTQIYYCLRTTGGVGIETYTGDGTSGVYFWGAQTELNSSYPTSYISTTSASATRVADACVKTGISSLIGQTEGVVFADFNFEQKLDTSGSIVILLRGSSSEAYIYLTSSNVQADFISGGIQCSILGSIGAVGRKKIAFAYKQNDFALYMNGVQIGTDSSGTVGSLTALTIGSYDSPGYLLNSGISQAILFSTRLTNSELASLTTI
jgi:hypothetical protein